MGRKRINHTIIPEKEPAEVHIASRRHQLDMKLTFDRGTIQIQGDVHVPNSTCDERSKTYRVMALYYRDVIDFLKRSGFDFRDEVLDLLSCPELQAALY